MTRVFFVRVRVQARTSVVRAELEAARAEAARFKAEKQALLDSRAALREATTKASARRRRRRWRCTR
jgi:hypothetical protein